MAAAAVSPVPVYDASTPEFVRGTSLSLGGRPVFRITADRAASNSGHSAQVFQAEVVLSGTDKTVQVALKIPHLPRHHAVIHKEWTVHERLKGERLPFVIPALQKGLVSSTEAPFLVFPWGGADLFTHYDMVHRKGCSTLREAGKLLFAVLVLLDALHKRKWVHTDIKPENFVLSPEGALGAIDLATLFHADDGSDFRRARGTPGSNAPEVILGLPPRPPEDLFSTAHFYADLLGISLYPWPSAEEKPGAPPYYFIALHRIRELLGPDYLSQEAIASAPYRDLYFDCSPEGVYTLKPISPPKEHLPWHAQLAARWCDDPLFESAFRFFDHVLVPEARRLPAAALAAGLYCTLTVVPRPLPGDAIFWEGQVRSMEEEAAAREITPPRPIEPRLATRYGRASV